MILNGDKVAVLKFLSGSDEAQELVVGFLLDGEFLVGRVGLGVVEQLAAVVVALGRGRGLARGGLGLLYAHFNNIAWVFGCIVISGFRFIDLLQL